MDFRNSWYCHRTTWCFAEADAGCTGGDRFRSFRRQGIHSECDELVGSFHSRDTLPRWYCLLSGATAVETNEADAAMVEVAANGLWMSWSSDSSADC